MSYQPFKDFFLNQDQIVINTINYTLSQHVKDQIAARKLTLEKIIACITNGKIFIGREKNSKRYSYNGITTIADKNNVIVTVYRDASLNNKHKHRPQSIKKRFQQ